MALAGTIYGALLYVVNFLVIAPLAFPIFEMANQPFELVVHVVFGTVLSLAFFGSDRVAVRASSRQAGEYLLPSAVVCRLWFSPSRYVTLLLTEGSAGRRVRAKS